MLNPWQPKNAHSSLKRKPYLVEILHAQKKYYTRVILLSETNLVILIYLLLPTGSSLVQEILIMCNGLLFQNYS
jgi:preprotein translocase subunit SecF